MLHSTLRIHRNDEMENLFASAGMAAGYASSRPPVHRLILEIAWPCLAGHQPPQRALDLGCGSGLSTRALLPLAAQCFGVEPAVSMLRQASAVAPVAAFAAGSAEQLPFGADSMDVITAAGSLNYCAVEQAFPEMLRVLKPGGALLVYDFSPGRRFRDSDALDLWFAAFLERYPHPPNHALSLDPQQLAALAKGFLPGSAGHFEGALLLDQSFYLNYMLTETNVAHAIRTGTDAAAIRRWCEDSLLPVFAGQPREVVFEGYWAVFGKPNSANTRSAL